ncbi:MAG: chemotaxis response regulator protein-glutamate methylesterase [Gloeocapsa sp. UFS-A4-WI-NPMV-4B04]|jgi:two-component system response regulator WspF|nr:chemotaxis response regulator protein-glutamate methylesterase [Gloeocapsa sp. UFS-A4-WI-NPMV-4B04]
MKIAIVNDMVIAVEALRRVLLTVPEYQVAWIAANGAEAVAKCAKDTPDLILMDLLMPVMDGVEATRQIMKQSPCAIVIVTANVGQNTAKVFEAMSCGALDAVNTPILGSQGKPEPSQAALLGKIATIAKLIGKSTQGSNNKSQTSNLKPQISCDTALPPLVTIGSSTGGPKALATILSRLPANFGAAIAIVQHVDAQFAVGMIDWLNNLTPLTVKKASVGDRLEKGIVSVACTNDHLCLQSNHTLNYTKDPIDYPYRPSIDVFFKSVAQYWTPRGTAILLTGMGRDGAEGLKMLRSHGWHTIAQDQASCVVYGMPRAAVELNAAVEVLNPDAIIISLLQRSVVSY